MRRLLGVAALAAAGAAAGCGGGETAVMRGDQMWADSQYTAALAEYRLALQQSGGDEAMLLRVAHAFARTDDFDRAKQSYDRLLSRAPEHTPQAVYDYLMLSRRARERGDRYGMMRAAEAALELQPDLAMIDLALPLARYYEDTSDPERALVFYRRALAQASADAVPSLLYAIGRLYEERNECGRAIEHMRAYRVQAPDGEYAGEAAWYQGRCAFRLAREARRNGLLTAAQAHLQTVVSLGVPETDQEEAWFLRGEILFALGRFDQALESYYKVLELNPERTGRLVEQAQRRIDQIRFRG